MNENQTQTQTPETAQAAASSSAGQPADVTQRSQTTPQAATQGTKQEAALMPPVDVIEDAGGITLLADMPGVTKDTLTLALDTNRLTIEGEVALAMPQEMTSSLAEVKLPRYRRTFSLSSELDGEQASAELRQGVLSLRIPKAQHAQPRKIQIQAT